MLRRQALLVCGLIAALSPSSLLMGCSTSGVTGAVSPSGDTLSTSGTWQVKVGRKSRPFHYTKASARLETQGGRALWLDFGGAGSASASVMIMSPQSIRVNRPVAATVTIAYSDKLTDNFITYGMGTYSTHVIFTAKNLKVGGKLSGRVTGEVRNSSGTKAKLLSCPFRNVVIGRP